MAGSILNFIHKKDKIEIWGLPPCSRAGPFHVGDILEPGKENPLINIFKPLGVDLIKQIATSSDIIIDLWRDIFGRSF